MFIGKYDIFELRLMIEYLLHRSVYTFKVRLTIIKSFGLMLISKTGNYYLLRLRITVVTKGFLNKFTSNARKYENVNILSLAGRCDHILWLNAIAVKILLRATEAHCIP